MMLNDGSKIKHLEAQIFGEAYNPKISPENIGRDNIKIARNLLAKKNTNRFGRCGGEKGRKIVFNIRSGEVAVLKVGTLRQGDWYPYQSDR
ncbi:MAG: hypothetical protein ABIK98_10920 [Pseudomonadota bacterium]|uniref:Uncharacterized protein n=1 Tax=Candidatus Desulfatibia profunda TaxID=2841695 RepID=A0A8J6NK51_9BACT|nr:hypothetical protein [Candidatus Desulfatibia profunda]MBL7179103.1 hypothetical protein [Desulfobacterales bacterium]